MVDIDDRFARRLSGWAGWMSHAPIVPTSSPVRDPPRAMAPHGMTSGGLVRAQEAWAAALELWHDEDDAFEFLTRKHAMLDDQRPIFAAIESNEGLRSVKSIIGRLKHGSAA